MKKLLATLALAVSAAPLPAAEGMWTLDNLPAARIAKEYGFRPDADWSRHAMLASARLAGGCSASFVSPDGLVLTNHHCAINCVKDISTADGDYVVNGFLAAARRDEIQCPGVELNRLEAITDVSQEVKSALAGLSGDRHVLAERAVTARLTATCAAGDAGRTRCDVVNLYHGGRYHLYRYRRFQDIRLAFVPEKDIAYFGGDPDNFNFPRHALDMALLRVYENGQPAKIDTFFRVNPAGAAEGEPIFITGHPGHTDRQLTTAQLEARRDLDVVQTLLVLAEKRGLLTEYAKSSPEAARVSATDLFGIENGFKALTGQLRALQEPALWRAKAEEEKTLRPRMKKAGKDSDPWTIIARALTTRRAQFAEYRALEAEQAFWSPYFRLARILVRGAAQRGLPDGERFPEYGSAALPRQEQLLLSRAPIYPDYERTRLAWSLGKLREWLGADDYRVQAILGRETPEQVAARLIAGTQMGDVEFRRRLWQGGAAAIAASQDPMIVLARTVEPWALQIRHQHETEVDAVIRAQTERIAAARFAVSGTTTYPDATFTLRLSWGEMRGWKEGEREVPAATTFGTAFGRATGAPPYALPPRWLTARTKLNPAQPFNFATTHDIIGGNSGSPLINRHLEVVGLAFDGNIHSLGGDYWYDPRLNRAVAVHSGAMVEALEKIYGGQSLVREMLGR